MRNLRTKLQFQYEKFRFQTIQVKRNELKNTGLEYALRQYSKHNYNAEHNSCS